MSDHPAQPCWHRELRLRVSAHLTLKSLGIPAFFAGFFVLYFQLLRHPLFPVTEMPLTVVDRWLASHPAAIVPYLSLWVYAVLPPTFLRGRREVKAYTLAVAALTAAGLAIFCVWPSATPVANPTWAAHESFAFLKGVDAAGNACPSLHVAFAIFTAIWLERLLRQVGAPLGVRLLNAAWSVAIVYSTMAARQHVLVDVLGGIALGGAAALPYPRQEHRHFGARYSLFNRQTLALAVSITSKTALFLLHLHATHPLAATVLFLAPDVWILAGLLIPNTSLLVPTATCFETTRREIWLTVDDGPDPATTEAMLDLLERHQAKATFFLIGRKAAERPDLVRRILACGHSLGNHTETHPLASFWLAGPQRTRREIGTWHGAAADGHLVGPRWFRPPAGIKTLFLRRALARHGAVLVGWSARGRENLGRSISRPLQRLKSRIRPGAILLLHQSDLHGSQRVGLLSAVLEHLAASGYRCVLPSQAQLRSSFAQRAESERVALAPAEIIA